MNKLLDFIVTGCLSQQELIKIRKEKNLYAEKSDVSRLSSKNNRKGRLDLSIRNSCVYFPSCHNFPHTFNILQSIIIESYRNICNYIDYSNIPEIQYARYNEGQFFKKHSDSVYRDDKLSTRILTFSINISEENSYRGGDLLIYDKDIILKKLSKIPGSFILFPSFYIHEATTVEWGLREAIVTWIHCDYNTFERFKKYVTIAR